MRTGYVNSLIEIIEFSKQRNIKVILIKQAYFFENNVIEKINNFSVDELIKRYKDDFFIKNYKLDETINFWSVIGTILNKKLDGLENYNNVQIVDPVKSLISSKKNFVDYLHLTPKKMRYWLMKLQSLFIKKYIYQLCTRLYLQLHLKVSNDNYFSLRNKLI